jgi:hypothetical protein
MAWERSFEAKVMKVREKELRYQKLNYMIEVPSSNTLAIFLSLDFEFCRLSLTPSGK